MLVKEVNRLDLEPLKHPFHDEANVLGSAIQKACALPRLLVDVPTELGGNYHLLAEGCECFTNKLLVHKGAIGFSSVEEGHTSFDGGANYLDTFRAGKWLAVHRREPHTAVAKGRDIKIAFS